MYDEISTRSRLHASRSARDLDQISTSLSPDVDELVVLFVLAVLVVFAALVVLVILVVLVVLVVFVVSRACNNTCQLVSTPWHCHRCFKVCACLSYRVKSWRELMQPAQRRRRCPPSCLPPSPSQPAHAHANRGNGVKQERSVCVGASIDTWMPSASSDF